MKILGIIPARFDSSRFPGKPLIDILGKSMIQRVYERSRMCASLSDVVVATDDTRIFDHVISFGGKAMMTSKSHQTGTDRCVEIINSVVESYSAVINIQGDEPTIDPRQLELVASCFQNPNCELATLALPIKSEEILFDSSKIKLVIDQAFNAVYFSRQAIPFQQKPQSEWLTHFNYLKHVGIYGYRTDVLNAIGKLPPSSLELAESLEQLTRLESGYKIQVRLTDIDSISVDIPKDVNRVIDILNRG